ncbi:MAG: LTA synthase family protein [Endomicrobium sp.]|jgi:phosphoglycerol transferase MdoB-like AlkP superfamily enzyme|nr:LTA synthase family protein [Endomicrobium sp.]
MVKEYNFEKYFDCLLKIVPINIAALAAMTAYRVFFLFYFADFGSLKGLYIDIFKAFVLGLRFDLSVLAYLNSFVILIFTVFLFLRNLKVFKLFTVIIKLYFWLAFTASAALTIIDFGFFTYFYEHINLLFFQFFEDDTVSLAKTIVYDWRFPMAFTVLVFVSYTAYKFSSYTCKMLLNMKCIIASSYWSFPLKTIIVLIVICMTFITARGTVSMFPLGTFHTQISTNHFINKLSISSMHSLTDALYAKSEQSRNKIKLYEKLGIEIDSVDLSIFNKITPPNSDITVLKPNVVFIVLESFGEVPILYNSENFNVLAGLKKHFDEDTVLYNFLAAGRITIHCLESTILNMPQRPYALQITQSPLAYNEYSSAAALPYKNAGYDTKAIYGGSLTWRGIESFFKTQGFNKTFGEGSIKNKYRHEWGINDAQFFEIILRELNEATDNPKFIYAMSTGTHPPYEIPPYYKPLPLNIPAELLRMMRGEKKYGRKIFETYQFANHEAAKFLDAIKNSDLAENTIVVITGDHNLREINPLPKEDLFKKYAVPTYIYMPKKIKKQIDANIAASHMDIIPTLYDLSLSETAYVAAGVSLLDDSKKHIAFNSEGFILSEDKVVLYNIDSDEILYFNFDTKSKTLTETQYSQRHGEMLDYYKNIVAAADIYLNTKK